MPPHAVCGAGWVTHTTEIPRADEGRSGCASLHGVFWFERLTETLWGPEAMRRRCGEAGCATLSAAMGDADGRCIADILALNPGMRVVEDERSKAMARSKQQPAKGKENAKVAGAPADEL